MELGALPMLKLSLVSIRRTSVHKKREVVKSTTKSQTHHHNIFNLQEHQEVSPSIPLEIKYTQTKYIKIEAHVENNMDFGKYNFTPKISNTSCALHQAMYCTINHNISYNM